MANQHKRVKDLVSEVTFGKVEHILQVNTLPGGWRKSGLPLRHFHVYHVLTHSELRNYGSRRICEKKKLQNNKNGSRKITLSFAINMNTVILVW